MAFGTLKADTLTHSTAGSLATNFVVNGSAKTWIIFNMSSSFTNSDSFNVSSLDDDGQGDFGINFTNSMSSANYPATSGAGEDNANVLTNFGTVTTSAMDGQTRQTQANSAIDKFRNSVAIHGDLA